MESLKLVDDKPGRNHDILSFFLSGEETQLIIGNTPLHSLMGDILSIGMKVSCKV